MKKEYLIQEYIQNKKSSISIAKNIKCTKRKVLYWLKKYNIKIRSHKENNILKKGRTLKELGHKDNCKCNYCKAKRKENIKEQNPFYGKKHTKITKIHWSKIRKGISPPNKGKTNLHEGKKMTSNGYIIVYYPNHPMSDKNGWILEHRLVMANYLNRILKSKEIVHHINGKRDDNKIDNLMLFPNASTHKKFRHYGVKSFICKFCRKDQRKK